MKSSRNVSYLSDYRKTADRLTYHDMFKLTSGNIWGYLFPIAPHASWKETEISGLQRMVVNETSLHSMQSTVERRSVTSRYHGSAISGWQQNQRRQRRQGERQKKDVYIYNQQLCRCITLFCTFLCRRCTTTTWNFLISRARFME